MHPKDAFLGLDIGGTGAKAGLFDREGVLLGLGYVPYSPLTSPEGWVEIAIDTIESACRTAVRQALQGRHARVLAMSVSSQGQTFVVLDAKDKPLANAILWYDSRAHAQAEQLTRTLRAQRPHRPLPRLDAIASGPKIQWLRERDPALMSHARRYLLLPDYIAYRLTGRAATDPITASSSGLFSPDSLDYDPEVLQALQIDYDQVAEILPSGTPIATMIPKMAEAWGLQTETMLVTGTNDQFAGALGAGNCKPGILTEASGTCLALVTLTPTIPEPHPPGLICGAFPIPGLNFALAYSKTAGVVIDWFRREFAPDKDLRTLDEEASAVPAGSRKLIMLPHFDGTVSPVPNSAIRGVIYGLTLQHTRADMYRAILESLCCTLRENTDFIEHFNLPIEIIRSIGGGAKSELWMQIKADVLGRPVEQPVVTEAPVLGAAMLAAMGFRAFPSLTEVSARFYRARKTFTPNPANQSLYNKTFLDYLELKRLAGNLSA